tara:strand:- start:24644 stop:24799 length:156 start_codon:yes stop_codon:yes gene_type:complete
MIVNKYPTNAEIEMLRKKRKKKRLKWRKGTTVSHNQSGDIGQNPDPGGGGV